ncbi:uncharacterized protein TNIN_481901 [Trichonephila inaurata madagascariensis]|uniref:Uncharacterized protein n=1 Tax=Trichonephila inaurata madagascariensis TaxID=2747483 RepID=A0A8X6WY10_9ARAC|nr:uncharacterized protein TNIN_481901 [Trichonephila inaurata madagascariensis]
MRGDGGGASLCGEVPSFQTTPSFETPVFEMHPRCHLRTSCNGGSPGEWHPSDDRDEEIAHQLRLWRFLVSPEHSSSSSVNYPLQS